MYNMFNPLTLSPSIGVLFVLFSSPCAVEFPKLSLLKVELPDLELPKPEFPHLQLPKVDLPNIELLKPRLPKIDLPIKLDEERRNDLTKFRLDELMKKTDMPGKIKLEDFPNSADLDDLLKEIIYRGLIEYEEHNTKFPLLEWAIDQLGIPIKLFKAPLTTIKNTNVCNACAAIFKYLTIRSRMGVNRNKLLNVLTFICKAFKISSERVCHGAIDLNIDTLLYILKEKKSLNELKICATVCQNYGCFKEFRSKWEVFVPNMDLSNYKVKQSIGKSFRILQITDLHLDPLYAAGGNADCGEPLCCQNDQSLPSKSKSAAGQWSDYRDCDMPYYSFKSFLEQITTQIKQDGQSIDYVYFTGDIINHRVWSTSRKDNTEQILKAYGMLKEYFGYIPIYSIIGNHEPHPINVFSPPSITNETLSTAWLYDVLREAWSKWLPSTTDETVRYGYYTHVVKPGFRIIAINSNICYTFNWWLLYDDVDPFNQLRWLSITLKEAEMQNESVHILSHVPPGDDTCIQEWTRQFRRLIERYAHIIKGQFNGHTHLDELRIFFNTSNPNQVVNVAYNGGSFTTFSNLNPNYRYYTIDLETYEVLDFEQWTYNLNEANAHPDKPPQWFKLYSFKDAYGLTGMKNEDMEHLVTQMSTNRSLLTQYYRFKVRDASPSILEGCKGSCHKENLCNLVTTEVDDDTQCKAFTKHFSKFLF